MVVFLPVLSRCIPRRSRWTSWTERPCRRSSMTTNSTRACTSQALRPWGRAWRSRCSTTGEGRRLRPWPPDRGYICTIPGVFTAAAVLVFRAVRPFCSCSYAILSPKLYFITYILVFAAVKALGRAWRSQLFTTGQGRCLQPATKPGIGLHRPRFLCVFFSCTFRALGQPYSSLWGRV